jgi:DNA-binding PadR family transcriptional regulator
MSKTSSRKPAQGTQRTRDLEKYFMSRKFLRPSILLLLAEEPSHGYALRERLIELGVADKRLPSAIVYRFLRDLESEKLAVSDQVVEEGRGPARKVYRLTAKGWEDLGFWSDGMKSLNGFIFEFQNRYESAQMDRKNKA